jgi:hypothetical protein
MKKPHPMIGGAAGRLLSVISYCARCSERPGRRPEHVISSSARPHGARRAWLAIPNTSKMAKTAKEAETDFGHFSLLWFPWVRGNTGR